MAALDANKIPFKGAITTIALADDTGTPNTLTLTLVQGSATWTEPGRAVAEARERGRHLTKPTIVETDDQNVSLSISALVDTVYGNTAVSLREFVTFTNGASAFVSTASGAAPCVKVTLTLNSTVDGGGSQTVVFAYAHCDELSWDDAGTDGLATVSLTFTDFESRPTYA